MIEKSKALEILNYTLLQGMGESVPISVVEKRFEHELPILKSIVNDHFISRAHSPDSSDPHYEISAKGLIFMLESLNANEAQY